MRRRILIIPWVAVSLLLAACSGSAPASDQPAAGAATPVVADGPVTIEQESDAVVVIATFDPANPGILDVAFDTHSVDLAFDVAATSMLAIDGEPTPIGDWDGTEPGGHHRWGTLTIGRAPASGEVITYTFTGLSDTLTFAWSMP